MSSTNAKSSRETSLLPSSDSSVPIGCVVLEALDLVAAEAAVAVDDALSELDLLRAARPASPTAAFASSNGITAR